MAIAVLANDSDPDRDALQVRATDGSGTKGAVAVNPDGTVTYDPRGQFDALAPGETATDSFTYTASDGAADSNPATVTVTVGGANEPPSLAGVEGTPLAYTAGDPAVPVTGSLTTADQDGGTLSGAVVSIASGHVAGDELAFTSQNGISGSFDAGNGRLTLSGPASLADYQAALRSVTYETALATPSGSRTISFRVDDGSSASNVVAREIAITHPNQAPAAADDDFTGGLGNTQLAVGTSAPGPTIQIAGNVLDNDTDLETPRSGLTVTAGTTTVKGGTVTMNPNGSFVYLPPQGAAPVDDSFDYTLHDNDPDAKTDTGSVDVHVSSPTVWYVDNSLPAAGDGRSTSPFNSLAPLTTGGSANSRDDSNDVIFLYDGGATYTGGIVLEPGQKLVGEPDGLTVSGNALVPPGGSNPAVANAAGDAINLASASSVQRVNVTGPTSGVGVRGTSVTTSTIGPDTSISGATGGAFALSGSGGNVTVGANITNTAGKSVSVGSRTTGTVRFDGTITDTGTGISLQNNGNATVNFANALTLTTGANDAFSATGGGTVIAGNVDNTATTTTGVGVRIANTNIGSSPGVIFKRVSSNGAPSGIVLDHTGSGGGLTVTGETAGGSGGTIQNTTGPGISMDTTRAPSFHHMNITNPQGAGIRGTGVNGFTLMASVISGAGAAQADDSDASIAFNTIGAQTNNLSGAVVVTDNTLQNGFGGGLDVHNFAGTISDATITGNAISSSSNPAQSEGDGIGFDLLGSASGVANLTRATINGNAVTGFPNGGGIRVVGGNTTSASAPAGTYGTYAPTAPGTGTNTVTISNNLIAGDATNRMNAEGIHANVEGRGSGNFRIANNGTAADPVRNMKAEGIFAGAGGDADVSFLVSGNFVSPATVVAGRSGIVVGSGPTTLLSDPDVDAAVTNNNVSSSDGAGIRMLQRDSNGTTNLRIQNNVVGAPLSPGTPAIRVDAGNNGDAAFNPTLCSQIEDNNATASSAASNTPPGITLAKRSTSATTYRFGIVGLAPSPATAEQAEAHVETENPGSSVGTGTFAGERVAVTDGNQFTSCSLAF